MNYYGYSMLFVLYVIYNVNLLLLLFDHQFYWPWIISVKTSDFLLFYHDLDL